MKRSRRVAIRMTVGMIVVCGAIEVVLVVTIRPMQNHYGKDIAVKFFGVLSCILISVALFPQYYEIYKLKAVIGISLVFIAIDMLGGLLNDLSLVFSERFDVLAAISYTLVIVLDAVIFVCAGAFKFLAWRRRRRGETTGEGGGGDSEVGNTGVQEPPDRELNSTPLQHLTILSRSASRLSQTPSKFSWIVSEDVGKDGGVKSTSKSVEEEEREGDSKGGVHEDHSHIADRIGTVNLPPSPSPPPRA
ncbi:hypothetical protein EST38_g8071 [Candolleomyces aberdarensis]|uniref:PQ loop repeat protein n=1 Tax=Candolleomyces aberdarensis TaxID=2316362 RepID=A0A4Q2DDH0_9AGAR|nr:hypothetical protein EST38_g8071 [Candolleomyces aberdarensis]